MDWREPDQFKKNKARRGYGGTGLCHLITLAQGSPPGTADVWGWVILCCRAVLCAAGCCTPQSPPSRCQEHRIPHPPTGMTENVSRACQASPGRDQIPPAENPCLKAMPIWQSSSEPSGDWLALRYEQAMKGHQPACKKSFNFKVREQNKQQKRGKTQGKRDK